MSKKYKILIVGAGLSAATCCALLNKKYSILVIDCKDHIGGICYDELKNGTYIQKYGPHIFNTNNTRIYNFLTNFTQFKLFKYIVKSEIIYNSYKKEAYFPPSYITEQEFGKKLTKKEIVNIFFKDYSEKMWGTDFKKIDKKIINRISQEQKKTYSYFKDKKYELLPINGYKYMFSKMFKNCDIELNVDKDAWKNIKADIIIYTGRSDLILEDSMLPYRTLNINFAIEEKYRKDISALHFCHKKTSYIRKVYYDNFYNTKKNIVSYEEPVNAKKDDTSPMYPINNKNNNTIYNKIKKDISKYYQNIILLGRLGRYKYLNMDDCVLEAISMCKKIFL